MQSRRNPRLQASVLSQHKTLPRLNDTRHAKSDTWQQCVPSYSAGKNLLAIKWRKNQQDDTKAEVYSPA
jgi:hypothetical protein